VLVAFRLTIQHNSNLTPILPELGCACFSQGNWLTGDGVHMKPLGDAIMAVGVLRALGVPDEKLKP
jgi:hypothetical protein